jgi:hypothetical protein
MCNSKQLLPLFATDMNILNVIHCFIFVSPRFKARKFFFKFIVKFTRSLWHIIGKKYKNVYLSLCSMKIQHKFVKNYKTASIQNKICNMQAQIQ